MENINEIFGFYINYLVEDKMFAEWFLSNTYAMNYVGSSIIDIFKNTDFTNKDQKSYFLSNLRDFIFNKYSINLENYNIQYCYRRFSSLQARYDNRIGEVNPEVEFYQIPLNNDTTSSIYKSLYERFHLEEIVTPDIIEIDLSNINNYEDLQLLLYNKLNFPSFYGMNWNAFWDAITGLITMPKTLIFIGWNIFISKFPDDSKIMLECLNDYNKEYADNQFKLILK